MNRINREIFSAKADIISRVNEVLRPLGKKLWRISDTDALRLRRLLVWSEKYSVSLNYIMDVLLPALNKAVERRTGRKTKAGLGVTPSILTGDVAKDILLERIAKDFPGNEHVMAYREQLRTDMVTQLYPELYEGKPSNPLNFSNPEDYTLSYEASIRRKRREREKLERQIARMPFRSNPFR